MPKTSIHFVGYHPSTSVQSRAMKVLAERLDQTLGDAIEFRFTSDIASLGKKANDLLPMVEAGELDGCYFYSSYLAGRVPELSLFELPFQIEDRTRAYELLDGPLGVRLAEAVEGNTGYKVLAYWDNGMRHISNRARRIRRPEDCRGLKIRTAFNELHKAAFRALGFEPMAIDVKDLPAAVKDGTVDAQENPLTNIINYQVQAYHPHITLTGHLFGISAVLANADRFRSWPEPVRQALADALTEATAVQRAAAAQDDVEFMQKLTAEGAQIVSLSDEERAAFAAAVASLVSEERKRFAPDLLAAFDGRA